MGKIWWVGGLMVSSHHLISSLRVCMCVIHPCIHKAAEEKARKEREAAEKKRKQEEEARAKAEVCVGAGTRGLCSFVLVHGDGGRGLYSSVRLITPTHTYI
jgi:hypothetical protein